MSVELLTKLLTAETRPLYVALSGGIDSLTLMTLAATVRMSPTTAIHAVSAAVPEEATARNRGLSVEHNWKLIEIDAGEFESSQYVSNPVNRCYHCKSHLFDSMLRTIRQGGEDNAVIATGTNTDDLGDFRPGLQAASERDVWQPYTDAGVDKALSLIHI